jgi:hypothetical protein
VLAACARLTDAIHPGLDLRREIDAVLQQGLGDTVLVWDEDRLAAFAVCHAGAGSEAGSGTCYVKFGAAQPGPLVPRHFHRLLLACEAFAVQRAATRLVAGVNTARHEAYQELRAAGFRPFTQGICMQRYNDPGYNRPGVYLIDDWR